jgi:hypothetical protein
VKFVNLSGVEQRVWHGCTVAHCTFEGTNAVPGYYSEWFYYCDEHLAKLTSLPQDRP